MEFIQTSLLSSVIPVVTYSTISLQWGIWAQIALPPPTLTVSDLLWNRIFDHLGFCLLQRFSYYYLRYLNQQIKLQCFFSLSLYYWIENSQRFSQLALFSARYFSCELFLLLSILHTLCVRGEFHTHLYSLCFIKVLVF